MDEKTLQALSQALTHLVFRNGTVGTFLAKYCGQIWYPAEWIDLLM